MATFISLPYEIRDIVYRLVLVYEHPVAITSPCPKHKCSVGCSGRSRIETDKPQTFANISRANKQISAEACVVFYSLNIFLVSNNHDHYHSPDLANLHGLQALTARVPAQKIGLVRRIYCAMHIPGTRPRTHIRPFFTESEVNQILMDIRSMSRSLEKYFGGVESVRLIVLGNYYGAENVSAHNPARYDAIPGVAWATRKILNLEKLKEVRYHQSTLERQPELVEKTLKKDPKGGRLIEVFMDDFKLEPK